MSKVVFVLHSLRTGGCERQATLLITEFKKRGHDTLVLACHPVGQFCEELNASGVRVAGIGSGRKFDIAGMTLGLARQIREFAPDVIYSFLQLPNVLTGLIRSRVRQPKLVWGMRSSNQDLRPYGRLLRAIYRLEGKLSHVPDQIIANSHAGRTHAISRGFPSHNFIVIPNGIDTQRFRPDPELRQATRLQLGIKPDEFAVGLVARLDPFKDHTSFLNAAARARSENPQMKFISAGGGPSAYAEDLKAHATKLGLNDRVLWLGSVSDTASIFNACDIITLTSSSGEGFPNSIGEAMACGRVCAVTDVGDCSRIVGQTGIVTPPSNPNDLADSWVRLSTMDLQLHETNARSRIESEYSIENLIDTTEVALCLKG